MKKMKIGWTNLSSTLFHQCYLSITNTLTLLQVLSSLVYSYFSVQSHIFKVVGFGGICHPITAL